MFFIDEDPSRKQKTGWRGVDPSLRISALRLLRIFSEPPKFFTSILWELALGTSPKISGPARRCLETISGIEVQIIEKLCSRTATERAEASLWLSELNAERSIPLIKKALRKERTEKTKIAMIDALAAMNVPEAEFLDREGLLKEAQKFVAKGTPSALSWFPFGKMPIVHWADSGEVVDPDILIHFILQGFRLKKPFPSALLKRYSDHMNPAERERFGQFVLEQWIKRDTGKRYSPEEEREYLISRARKYKEDATGESLERLIRNYGRAEEFKELMGSATKEKGILAVAAACCGPSAVQPIDHYLQTYYGWRPSQCKSLLSVLSWIDDYTAVKLLIGISERFRTPSIRKEAEKLVQELGDRKGWTFYQLSDRVLPTGGFDENGELVIPLEDLRFTVRVDSDLKVHLMDESGQTIKALPDPKWEDFKKPFNEAKKQLSQAKKAVSQIKKTEPGHLYQAMCTQRTWAYRDWERYLNHHSILKYYCQRIVWTVFSEDDDLTRKPEPKSSFLPGVDGVPRDLHGEVCVIDPEDPIRIAHSLTIGLESTEQWQVHTRNNKIALLLDQFPTKVYRRSSDERDPFEIREFAGHVVFGHALDRAAKRLGYVQGPKESARFDRYERKLSGSGIEIHLEFTGMYIPTMDEDVALKRLYFARPPQEGEDEWSADRRKIPLDEVNPILVSEGWNHLSAIARKGKGFDPEWEKRYGF